MKKMIALLLSITLVLGTMACGSQGAADQKENVPDVSEESEASEPSGNDAVSGEVVPLKISHHPYLHGLPSTYAVENGLYDCFDYTIDYYAGGPVQNEAIASGAWEVGTTGIAGAVLGITGYNMKVLGVAYDEASVTDMWCRSNSPLASAAVGENGITGSADDWRGLTVLIATGTNTHLMLIAALESLGLTEDDVNIVDCSSVPNVYTAFMAGEGDVACIWAPYGYTLQDDADYVKVGTIEDLGISLPALVVCTEEAYNNRPEVVEKWLGIFYESCDGLMADIDAAAEMMYEFSEEQGIIMSEDASYQEFIQRPLWSAADNKDYFSKNASGTTAMYELMMTYADFMVSQGKITQEQRDAMAESNFVSDMVLNLID